MTVIVVKVFLEQVHQLPDGGPLAVEHLVAVPGVQVQVVILQPRLKALLDQADRLSDPAGFPGEWSEGIDSSFLGGP